MISLRNRLLASYLFLLAFTLGGIVIALIITTGSQPAPPQTTYRNLAPHLTRIASDQSIPLPSEQSNQNPLQNVRPPNSADAPSELGADAAYTTYANENNVRIMRFSLRRDDLDNDTRRVLLNYDSDETLNPSSLIRLQMDNYEQLQEDLTVGAAPGFEFVFGRFDDKGQEWLFAGIQPRRDEITTRRQEMLIVAEPRPTLSLQNVLAEFGPSLVRPLLQASLIGLLIAIALSILISRTIAYPLQAAGDAATAVARGDLDHKVPLTGPKEVRAVAHAFNQMSAEVKATQQAQRDFVANVSHDLKTPLTSIQGYAQAIMDGATKNPTHAAEIIYDEAARLNRMVAELTDLARLEVGQLSMKRDTIDVGEIATMVAHKLSVVAQGKGIKLEARTAPMPTIFGDGDRIVQVFTNLLSNAIKYTKAGGRVAIKTQLAGDGVQVIVADTGVGIPEDDLPRIFERFYQVDKARGPSRGTGLGLAIVNEIVQLHGGTIEVKSKQGRGTTFTVWLPLNNREKVDKIPA